MARRLGDELDGTLDRRREGGQAAPRSSVPHRAGSQTPDARIARKATPEAAAKKYDEGHPALLAKLEAVRDDEWQLAVSRFGRMRSIEWYYRNVREHFDEHARHVRAVLSSQKAIAGA